VRAGIAFSASTVDPVSTPLSIQITVPARKARARPDPAWGRLFRFSRHSESDGGCHAGAPGDTVREARGTVDRTRISVHPGARRRLQVAVPAGPAAA
jgi:hypothetical protein